MSSEPILSKRRRNLLFINIILSCIASSMLATALATALPSMIEDFGVSVTTGQWLTSGYSLAMGIIMPLTAFLIGRFPTRKLYIGAITCFLLGLILCVVAPNFTILMCGRILQACGNGILTAMAQVIILSIFPDEEKGTAMGWYGLSVGAAPVLAPTLAGVLVDLWGWRMIFYAAIAVILLALIFAIRVFENVLDTAEKKFDISSFLISAVAFAGITLGIGNVGNYAFVSKEVLLLLAVGIGAMLIFVYRQLHLETPLLDLRILRSKIFSFSVIGSMVLYLVMMGSSIILPLYVQTIMGQSATISGLVALPGSLMMAVVSPMAGKIYDKLGIRILFIASAFCMMMSNIGMGLIDMETPLWVAAAYNVIRNVSIGCLMMPIITWGNSDIGQDKVPHGTALLASLRTVSGTIGSAVFVSIMTVVAASSAPRYGTAAQIHGLNVAYLAMAAASAVLLVIAVLGTRTRGAQADSREEG